MAEWLERHYYGAEDCGTRTLGWVSQRLENSLSNQRRIRQQKERNMLCLSNVLLRILKVGAGCNPYYHYAVGKLLPFMKNKMMGLTLPRLVFFVNSYLLILSTCLILVRDVQYSSR